MRAKVKERVWDTEISWTKTMALTDGLIDWLMGSAFVLNI